MRSHYRRDIGGIKSLAFILIAAIVKGLTRITFYDKARVRIPLAVRLPTRMVSVLKLLRNETRKKRRQQLEGKSTTKPAYTLKCKVNRGCSSTG